LISREEGTPAYPTSQITHTLNTAKKVDMSLAAEDERFVPKVRTY